MMCYFHSMTRSAGISRLEHKIKRLSTLIEVNGLIGSSLNLDQIIESVMTIFTCPANRRLQRPFRLRCDIVRDLPEVLQDDDIEQARVSPGAEGPAESSEKTGRER
jgi:hypothetical protein